jgi:NAD-dependent dihydropyrimidine dehydrogenase PreA subunit
MSPSRKYLFTFSRTLIDKPIVSKLIRDFDLEFNVLKANITPDAEGIMALELTGDNKKIDDGIKFVKDQGVKVEPLSKDIKVNWDKCVQCGACVSICPAGALFISDRKTMKIDFDTDKCIACELCIRPCPPRAIEVHYK